MYNVARSAIVYTELEQDRGQSDGGDHHDGEGAKKRSAICIKNDKSQYAAKHTGSNNGSAARFALITRHRFGGGIEFGQVPSDEIHCRHIWLWLRVASESPLTAVLSC